MPDPGSIRLLAPATRFVFQGGRDARAAASRAFGVGLPEEACRANEGTDRAALWLGPDEHLLLAPAKQARDVEETITTALAGIAHSLVDVSHRQVAFAIAGPAAADWLASGCPLDLDPAAFPVGMCTRTVLAKAEIILWRRGAEEYHLETGRSYSGYVLGWLREADH